MPGVEQHVDVAAPLDAVYDEWTRFEELPRFVEGVDEIRALDETHLLWRASHDDVGAAWTWEIVELRPQERIAWRSTSGVAHGGVVSFLRLADDLTRVVVMVEIDGGDAEAMRERIRATLARFKQLMEGR